VRALRKLAVVGLIAIAPALGMAGMASATPSPNGPGQPGTGGGDGSTSCANFTTTPGKAASAQSPFNPNGNAGLHYAGNPGTASAEHSNSTHSVSEYDIACFQQTVHQH
jgi:hypothetical protein